jgi:hypothetical protein
MKTGGNDEGAFPYVVGVALRGRPLPASPLTSRKLVRNVTSGGPRRDTPTAFCKMCLAPLGLTPKY